MSTDRTVTVGMPVYNDPDGLRRSVPTVFAQTWDGPLRLLVVDDGSDQPTVDVLEELGRAYPGLEVIRNPENRGRPYSRNVILEQAGDGYLTWLDAGDLLHPRKIELQMAALDAYGEQPGEPVLCTAPLRQNWLDKGTQRVKVPEVEGDQLRNALLSSLPGYLVTLIGRAEHFRTLGFDERLPRRQDYDLIVRFVAQGGRVIAPEDAPALVTYLKSDVGASADVVAESNRVIRREHAAFYDRYEPDLGRQVRRNQHLLVARFHENNGERLGAALYRTRAALARPAVLLVPLLAVLRTLARPLKRPARWGVRVLSRAMKGVMPALRSVGLTTLARRMGLVRLAARLGVMRIFYGEVKSDDPPTGDRDPEQDADRTDVPDELASAVRSADYALGRSQLERAIELLEEALDGEASDPIAWLMLEEAYRREGRLHSARGALERGIARHPGDPDLEVRLIELLALSRRWGEAVKRWTAFPPDDHEALTPLAYARVARAHRMLDDHRESLAVAEQGLERWPENGRIALELHATRPRTVDWARAVQGTLPRARAGSPDAARGEVEDLGFLAGGDGPIRGHLERQAPVGTPVSLLLNGRVLTTTNATPTGPGATDPLEFSLNAEDALEYLGDGDVLSVSVEGRIVPIGGHGPRCVVVPGYDSRSDELERLLDQGHVFTKFGRLAAGNSPERKAEVLDLFEEVAAVLAEDFGLILHPMYGNLLGAVREHDFIEHDVGGFDTGYLSTQSSPQDVRDEFLAICRRFAELDYHLRVEPFAAQIRSRRSTRAFLDLNFLWFNPAGELNLSYGWRYDPVTDRERFEAPRDAALGLRTVPVPGNAEDLLGQLYGPNWAIPIQGFAPTVELRRDLDYLLTETEVEALAASDPDRIIAWSVLADDGEIVPRGR